MGHEVLESIAILLSSEQAKTRYEPYIISRHMHHLTNLFLKSVFTAFNCDVYTWLIVMSLRI